MTKIMQLPFMQSMKSTFSKIHPAIKEFALYSLILLALICLVKFFNEPEKDTSYLMSPAEKLVMFELFNKTVFQVPGRTFSSNEFKVNFLKTLPKIRESAPARPDYFFCKNKEFGTMTDYIIENKYKMGIYPSVLQSMIDAREKYCFKK
jgi:hypothetical protein